MKITFFCSGLHSLGGTPKHLSMLMNDFEARGHKVKMIAASKNPEIIEKYLVDNSRISGKKVIDLSKSRILATFQILRELVRTDADVIVATFVMSEILTSIAVTIRKISGSLKIPKVVALVEVEHLSRSYSSAKRFFMTILYRLLSHNITKWVTISPHFIDEHEKMYGIPSSKFEIIHLGLREDEIETLKQIARNRQSGKQVRIGFVGRLVEDKGVLFIFEAARKLAALGLARNFSLHIFGEGPLKESLSESAASLKKQGVTVKMEGWASKSEEIYSKLDLVLLPSFHEGMSWVVVEAMIARCHVVGSPIPALRFLLEGDRGTLLSTNDGETLALTLAGILKNPGVIPEKIQASLINAQTWAMEKFQFKREVDRWEFLLKEINSA